MSAQRFKIEEIESAIENYGGFCISCGCEHFGIEPDARKYPCENCDDNLVFGAEELVIMGLVD